MTVKGFGYAAKDFPREGSVGGLKMIQKLMLDLCRHFFGTATLERLSLVVIGKKSKSIKKLFCIESLL